MNVFVTAIVNRITRKATGAFMLGITLCYSPLVMGQFSYHTKWFGFADNREYTTEYAQYLGQGKSLSQTFFGFNLQPYVEYNLDSNSMFAAGVNLIYNYGDNYSIKPQLVAYYRYKNEHYKFYMGSFNRMGLMNYPLALISDSVYYVRPNIEGAFIEAGGHRNFQNIWIDWTGHSTDSTREAFLAGTSGRVSLHDVFIDNYFILHHLSHTTISDSAMHLHENGGGYLRVGYNFSRLTGLDSCTLTAGYIQYFDRLRTVYEWKTPGGIMLEASARYKRIGAEYIYFKGEGLRTAFNDGNYFVSYTKGNYGRVNLLAIPFKGTRIESKFMWSFHFFEEKIGSSQQLWIFIKI
jgi:hypothetical protein